MLSFFGHSLTFPVLEDIVDIRLFHSGSDPIFFTSLDKKKKKVRGNLQVKEELTLISLTDLEGNSNFRGNE